MTGESTSDYATIKHMQERTNAESDSYSNTYAVSVSNIHSYTQPDAKSYSTTASHHASAANAVMKECD